MESTDPGEKGLLRLKTDGINLQVQLHSLPCSVFELGQNTCIFGVQVMLHHPCTAHIILLHCRYYGNMQIF